MTDGFLKKAMPKILEPRGGALRSEQRQECRAASQRSPKN